MCIVFLIGGRKWLLGQLAHTAGVYVLGHIDAEMSLSIWGLGGGKEVVLEPNLFCMSPCEHCLQKEVSKYDSPLVCWIPLTVGLFCV